MAIELVRSYLKQFGRDGDILELETSSATVALAAEALGVIPARIAKTLSFRTADGGVWLIVAAGDAKIDNPKYKAQFGTKASMLSPDEALAETGHAVGGICPFGIENPNVTVYLDVSLKRFKTVFPACGSSNSAIELNLDDLYTYSKALSWIDVCKGWEAE
jgi:prolyl-tRNA editing enzyme YbaK/EbsC (Cys-tRNA(Pro) deacylase)